MIDLILIKMATVELLYFPEIPEKVTINEYVEISNELKENINDYDPELFDELLDNVTAPSVSLNVIK